MKRRPSRISLKMFLVTALAAFIHLASCETEDWILETDCNECFSSEPDSADLIVMLTLDEVNDSIPVTVYRGPYEEGRIDWQDTATTENYYLYSAVDQEYSVRAIYRTPSGDTVLAYDGDRMTIKDAAEECGWPCYLVRGGVFDLRLAQ